MSAVRLNNTATSQALLTASLLRRQTDACLSGKLCEMRAVIPHLPWPCAVAHTHARARALSKKGSLMRSSKSARATCVQRSREWGDNSRSTQACRGQHHAELRLHTRGRAGQQVVFLISRPLEVLRAWHSARVRAGGQAPRGPVVVCCVCEAARPISPRNRGNIHSKGLGKQRGQKERHSRMREWVEGVWVRSNTTWASACRLRTAMYPRPAWYLRVRRALAQCN